MGGERIEGGQYLTFVLEEEVFAFEILKVREVLDFVTPTRVPRAPECMRGVINLRGSVVPVIDVRLKFGLSKTEKLVNTCIIIVEIDLEGETIVLGALADSVKEVVTLEADQIEPAPKIGTSLDTDFIRGMAKSGEEFIILLDIKKVFSSEEVAAIQGAESMASAGCE